MANDMIEMATLEERERGVGVIGDDDDDDWCFTATFVYKVG